MITRWEVVCVLLVAAGIAVGWLLGHWRAYAECCDCCTCRQCEPVATTIMREIFSDDEDGYDDGLDEVFGRVRDDLAAHGVDPIKYLAGDALPDRRHAVLLEPGPTIYPALAELAGEVMDGPHSDPEPTTSTWLMERRLWMEDRYPIPVGAP